MPRIYRSVVLVLCIARATGLSRPTVYDALGNFCRPCPSAR